MLTPPIWQATAHKAADDILSADRPAIGIQRPDDCDGLPYYAYRLPVHTDNFELNFEECTHAYPPVWHATAQQWQAQMTASRPIYRAALRMGI